MFGAISSFTSGLQHAMRGFAAAARTITYAPAAGEEQLRAVDPADAFAGVAVESHPHDPDSSPPRRSEAEAAAELIRRHHGASASAVSLRRLDQTLGTILDVEA